MGDVVDRDRRLAVDLRGVRAVRQERQQQAAQAYLQGLLASQTVTVDGAALTSVLDSAAK
jgi:hypothetical protein